LFKNFTAQI